MSGPFSSKEGDNVLNFIGKALSLTYEYNVETGRHNIC